MNICNIFENIYHVFSKRLLKIKNEYAVTVVSMFVEIQ